MAADDFFSRWSKHKTQTGQAEADQPDNTTAENAAVVPAVPPAEESLPPPTIGDVESLTHDSDYSRFVKKDVDEAVKRSALKKLFSNPHFNVMDGLDVYIDDYNKFTPMTPAMVASLKHAKDLLNPPGLKKSHTDSDEVPEVAVPMEMLSSQDGETVPAEQQAMPEEGNATEATDAADTPEITDETHNASTDVNPSLAPDQAAERMPGDQNKAISSPQGDS